MASKTNLTGKTGVGLHEFRKAATKVLEEGGDYEIAGNGMKIIFVADETSAVQPHAAPKSSGRRRRRRKGNGQQPTQLVIHLSR